MKKIALCTLIALSLTAAACADGDTADEAAIEATAETGSTATTQPATTATTAPSTTSEDTAPVAAEIAEPDAAAGAFSMMNFRYCEILLTVTDDDGNEVTQVYELTDPDGNVYTMQSYSLIEDTSITLADLPTLGDRLDLPEGWSCGSRVLDEPLQVAPSPDGALVVQDDLGNSYQRNR